IVVVDTQPPECDLQLVTGANNELLLQCQVRDANPDPSKTRLECQTSFGNWQPLAPHSDYPGCYRLPSPQALRGKLRYSVFDRAGNTASRTVNAASLKILTSTDSARLLAAAQAQSQSQKVAPPPPAAVVSNPPPGGVPPARGEHPDWWLEVDLTRPQARLLELRPGTNRDDLGTYQIIWTAADKNLKPQPIDLYYARRREGPWMPIAKGLPNTGIYR